MSVRKESAQSGVSRHLSDVPRRPSGAAPRPPPQVPMTLVLMEPGRSERARSSGMHVQEHNGPLWRNPIERTCVLEMSVSPRPNALVGLMTPKRALASTKLIFCKSAKVGQGSHGMDTTSG